MGPQYWEPGSLQTHMRAISSTQPLPAGQIGTWVTHSQEKTQRYLFPGTEHGSFRKVLLYFL